VGAAVIAHRSAAAEDDSKKPQQHRAPDGPGLGPLLLAVLGAVLLGLVEVVTVVQVTVGNAVADGLDGADRHGIAPALLALCALGLAWLVYSAQGRGGATLVGIAGLGLLGLVVLGLWALGDLPDLGQTGPYGVEGAPGRTGAGTGFWLELAAGLALLGSAVWALAALAPRGRGEA
jgi:hypothetical protein